MEAMDHEDAEGIDELWNVSYLQAQAVSTQSFVLLTSLELNIKTSDIDFTEQFPNYPVKLEKRQQTFSFSVNPFLKQMINNDI